MSKKNYIERIKSFKVNMPESAWQNMEKMLHNENANPSTNIELEEPKSKRRYLVLLLFFTGIFLASSYYYLFTKSNTKSIANSIQLINKTNINLNRDMLSQIHSSTSKSIQSDQLLNAFNILKQDTTSNTKKETLTRKTTNQPPYQHKVNSDSTKTLREPLRAHIEQPYDKEQYIVQSIKKQKKYQPQIDNLDLPMKVQSTIHSAPIITLEKASTITTPTFLNNKLALYTSGGYTEYVQNNGYKLGTGLLFKLNNFIEFGPNISYSRATNARKAIENEIEVEKQIDFNILTHINIWKSRYHKLSLIGGLGYSIYSSKIHFSDLLIEVNVENLDYSSNLEKDRFNARFDLRNSEGLNYQLGIAYEIDISHRFSLGAKIGITFFDNRIPYVNLLTKYHI